MALVGRAVSQHDLGHQLLVVLSRNSRFPEAPTIRFVGFPYVQEGLLNAGHVDTMSPDQHA